MTVFTAAGVWSVDVAADDDFNRSQMVGIQVQFVSVSLG